VAILMTAAMASSASANPATTPKFNGSASATAFAGLAFDQCTAPSVAAMTAWNASPYRAAGIYIGGVNRSCAQPQLTPAWVTQVSAMGWKLMPIYVGLQPSCGIRPDDQVIQSSIATSQGSDEAGDAVVQAKALGLLPGSAIYSDIENYATTDTQCRTDVLNYLSGWTTRLHSLGYLSGVYVNLSSGAQHLAADYGSTAHARPDALWIARYDGNPSLTGWTGIADNTWAMHGRAKQFAGNVSESYGGVTIMIDRNQWDAAVATVSYRHTLTNTTALGGRSGPSTSASVVRMYDPGSVVKIACQTAGSAVGTSKVWDKLTNGTYVPDYYADTASQTSYTPPIGRCSYPYQVTSLTGLTARTGPGATYSSNGSLTYGSLAWVACQKAGTLVKTSKVWDKLSDGRWVSDYYVATSSSTTYSSPIPRC
jgi:hypothetical protein